MIRRDKIRHARHAVLSGPPLGPGLAAFFCLLLTVSGGFLALAGLRLVTPGSSPLAPGREGMVTAAGLSFLSVGIWVGAHGATARRRRRRRERLSERYPFEPWLWDHAWDRRGVTDNSVRDAVGGAGRALFLTLFLSIFHGLLLEEGSLALSGSFPFVSRPEGAAAPGAGFFVVAVSLLVFDIALAWAWLDALSRGLRLLRHGRGRVRFESFPYLLGEELRVVLSLPRGGGAFRSARVGLRFIDEEVVTTTRQGKKETSVVAYQHYADERVLAGPELARLETGLALSFPLPSDLPGTSLSSEPGAYWQLDVRAESDGPDYAGRFLLPVYSTSPAAELARADAAGSAAATGGAPSPARTGGEVGTASGGSRETAETPGGGDGQAAKPAPRPVPVGGATRVTLRTK